MITRCSKKDEAKILSYIGKDYPSCLYLYLDLKNYGFNSEIVDIYVQYEDDVITSVLLNYYSCLHVFSRENSFDAEEIGTFIEKIGFSMVYCATSTSCEIFKKLPRRIKERAVITNGWVAQIKKIDREPNGLAVIAQQDDFEQIIRLIYEDEGIGSSYKFEELARQLEQRNQEGYARNIVIKRDSLVVAHACTNAEVENIAVVAELLVQKEFRRKGYASEIWRDICGKLLSEGKEVFSFYYSEESRILHKNIGFCEVCEWAKIVIDYKE